jgi:hypothetical protein
MGRIGDEIIRRTRERIIQMERHLAWMRSRNGFADEIAETERELSKEREALRWKLKQE